MSTIVVTLLFSARNATAGGEIKTWLGGTNWGDPFNWSPPGSPSGFDVVVFLPEHPNQVLDLGEGSNDPTNFWVIRDVVFDSPNGITIQSPIDSLKVGSISSIDYGTGAHHVLESKVVTLRSSDWDIAGNTRVTLAGGLRSFGKDYRITKMGSGTLTMQGNKADHSGPIEVLDGIVELSGSNFSTQTVLRVHNNGQVVFLDPIRVSNLGGDGSVQLNQDMRINGNTSDQWWSLESDVEFKGLIAGSGGIVKQGSGRQILAEGNMYTGGTTITGGSLYVNNPSGSATGTGNILVSSGGRLAGNGSVSGDVEVTNGTISPGFELGTLTTEGAVTLASNSRLVMELAGPVAGVEHDQLIASEINLAGTLDIRYVDFDPTIGDSFVIIEADQINGDFDNIVAPDCKNWAVSFTSSSVIVEVLPDEPLDPNDLEETVTLKSPEFFTTFVDQQSYTFQHAPIALSDVTLDVSSMYFWDGFLFLRIYLDGVEIATLFQSSSAGCVGLTDSITIPMATWNAIRLANSGSITVTAEPDTTAAGWNLCGLEFIKFEADVFTTFDCDADGILNDCETDDCDNNNISDSCQVDSDGDQVVDACDLCPAYDDAIDSDGDSIPDQCDQCVGFDDLLDCNNNGLIDGCELSSTRSFEFKMTAYPCQGNSAFDVTDLPYAALGDATLSVSVLSNNLQAPADYWDLYLNGAHLGAFFAGSVSSDCQTSDTMVVDAATFEAARSISPIGAYMELIPSTSVFCYTCGPFLLPPTVTVEYAADADQNANGGPDDCPVDCNPQGADTDVDGAADDCDLCPNTIPGHDDVTALGCPSAVSILDFDADGDVDADDVAGFFDCADDPDVPMAADCGDYDSDADADVDLRDFLDVQDCMSGTDQMSEVTCAGFESSDYVAVNLGRTVTYDEARDYCATVYGTDLASVNPEFTAEEQQQRIDTLKDMCSDLGDVNCWIGLRLNTESLFFEWGVDGAFAYPFEFGGCSIVDWWDDFLPTDSPFIVGSQRHCVYLYASENYGWRYYYCDGDNAGAASNHVHAFLCNAPQPCPDGTGCAEEGGTTGFNVAVTSGGIDSVTIGTGGTLTYDIVGNLSDLNNEGLAGFAVDLAFDGGSLLPAHAPSTSPMNSFDAPQGYTNPGGFGGIVTGGDLVQIGGAQNTLNNMGGLPSGSVQTGVAHTSQILASGSLNAPTTPGTYHLTTSNVAATVINQGQTGSPGWRVEPAAAGSVSHLTIIVVPCTIDEDNDGICDDGDFCQGDNTTGDVDNDGVCDDTDGCPNDPEKTEPGVCGCGIAEDDTDDDGTLDCEDGCPNDPTKVEPGVCGCGVADVDGDNDGVFACEDCDDQNEDAFPGNAEVTCDGVDNDCNPSTEDNPGGACDVQGAANAAEGPRYLEVTPGASNVPVALFVNSEAAPCLGAYIDFDTDGDLASQGIALLVDSPVYRLPEEWGTLHVRGQEVVPDFDYAIFTEVEGQGIVAASSVAITYMHGDVDNNGFANFADIQFVVQGFQQTFDGPLGAIDLAPCVPNGVVNFEDIQQAVFAFQGQGYETVCELPCNNG
ncbi:MAG: autotransporter-associated beta strand repeat-containing protein [Phycisphaerae bacterium]